MLRSCRWFWSDSGNFNQAHVQCHHRGQRTGKHDGASSIPARRPRCSTAPSTMAPFRSFRRGKRRTSLCRQELRKKIGRYERGRKPMFALRAGFQPQGNTNLGPRQTPCRAHRYCDIDTYGRYNMRVTSDGGRRYSGYPGRRPPPPISTRSLTPATTAASISTSIKSKRRIKLGLAASSLRDGLPGTDVSNQRKSITPWSVPRSTGRISAVAWWTRGRPFTTLRRPDSACRLAHMIYHSLNDPRWHQASIDSDAHGNDQLHLTSLIPTQVEQLEDRQL